MRCCAAFSMDAIMAEMYGKREGCSRGRGGSMHLFDAHDAPVRRQRHRRRRSAGGDRSGAGRTMQGRHASPPCFFGEGAIAEGAFHEAMNLAALWQLPVLFCCENNLYAMGTALARSESQTDLCAKAASYGMPARSVDGMDVVAVHEAAPAGGRNGARGGGPMFLELRTYRFRAHSMFDAELYRDKAEVERGRRAARSTPTRRGSRPQGMLTEEQFLALDAAARREVDEAVAFAEAGTWEPVEDLRARRARPGREGPRE